MLGVVNRFTAVIPGSLQRGGTKGVDPRRTKRMPITDAEPKPIGHRPACDDFICLIMLERKLILAAGTFERNFGNFGKVTHGLFACCGNQEGEIAHMFDRVYRRMHPEKSEKQSVFTFRGIRPIVFHVDFCTIAPFSWYEMNTFTASGGRQPTDDNHVAAYSSGSLLRSDCACITGWWLDAVCGPAHT